MIGDGWDGEPSVRPSETRGGAREATPERPYRVAVVTGTRAEFGLLAPVMWAIEQHAALELMVIAAGSHLIQPGVTYREVKKQFEVAAAVPMQVAGRTTRLDDAEALGVGVTRMARIFSRLTPDWVVVLGDRIEAFAAASAASVGGIAVAHLHGGDRAEGVADEAMRHAITKLAHLHLAATEESAERIRRMGEASSRVLVIGSPAADGLGAIEPMSDADAAELGDPEVVFLMHPIGRHPEEEEHAASVALEGAAEVAGARVLALDPNHDPGRNGIVRALDVFENRSQRVERRRHLPRARFVGLLKRLAQRRGALVGNSSAGLIEAAILGLGVVNIGARQAGRETPGNVVSTDGLTPEGVAAAMERARALDGPIEHPYGDGKAGGRAARSLAATDPHGGGALRKRNVY
ncbi:MAG: UDP-N-acetylglucosamine 2-epimerase [Planctomycetota bacterium]